MYPAEYRCTKLETNVTTTNIVAVKLSNKKPQETFNELDSIQVNNLNEQTL